MINNGKLFGVKMTLMMGSEMIPKLKASSKGRSDPLYDQVEAACENFAKLLQDGGLPAVNYEAQRNAEIAQQGKDAEEDPPSGSDFPASGHFSAGSLIAMAKFGELEGVLRRVDKAFEGRTSMEHLHSVDYMSEKILDRFSVALNWSAGLKERLDFQKVISHGELSGEGSTRILVRLDGEVVMFLSEESGMVSVPDNSGKPGSQFMQKAGFSISDIDVLFPLISLDLAETTRVTDFEYQLPIASQSYNTLLKQLAHNLDTMGLIEPTSLPVERDLTVEP